MEGKIYPLRSRNSDNHVEKLPSTITLKARRELQSQSVYFEGNNARAVPIRSVENCGQPKNNKLASTNKTIPAKRAQRSMSMGAKKRVTFNSALKLFNNNAKKSKIAEKVPETIVPGKRKIRSPSVICGTSTNFVPVVFDSNRGRGRPSQNEMIVGTKHTSEADEIVLRNIGLMNQILDAQIVISDIKCRHINVVQNSFKSIRTKNWKRRICG